MPYIIDGNNLIGSSPDISLDDPEARKKIIYILLRFQENKRNNIIVVFDGEPDRSIKEHIVKDKFTVLFPKYECSADDRIKELINNHKNSRDVILITSDRELKFFAKDNGVKTINSIEFYFELKRVYRISGKKDATLKRINTELSDNEVKQWLKIFERD